MSATKKKIAALIEETLRDPDDDAARLVLADKLIELGDPRGELIRLQAATPRAEETIKQSIARRKLTREHRDLLLGPLAKVLCDEEPLYYRLGFVDAADEREFMNGSIPKAMASPLCRSIRRLTGTMDLVGREELVSLREVTIIGAADLTKIASRPFVRLACHINENVVAFEPPDAFPKLTRLRVRSRDLETTMPALLASPSGARLEELTFASEDDDFVRRAVSWTEELFARSASARLVDVRHTNCTAAIHVERTGGVVSVTLVRPWRDYADNVELLRRLRAIADHFNVSRARVEAPGFARTVEDRRALQQELNELHPGQFEVT